MFYVKIW